MSSTGTNASLEERTRLFERRILKAFGKSIQGFALFDVDERVEFCNDAFARIFGLERAAQMLGRSLTSFIPPHEAAKLEEQLARRRRGESSVYELLVRTSSSVSRCIQVAVDPEFDADGTYVGSNAGVFDITDQVNLREQLSLLATAVDSAAEAIVLTDNTGKIKYVNPAFERVSGYSAAEAVGHPTSMLKSGSHSVEFYRQLWSTILAGETWRGRLMNRRRDGKVYHEEGSIAPVLGKSGEITHFVAVKRDITDELELYSQLLQSQKMENLALLTGGIVHDFNNMLAVVQGHAFLAAERLKSSNQSVKELESILDLCTKGTGLLKSLLSYARRVPGTGVLLDVSKAIGSMSDLLTFFAGKSNQLIIDNSQTPCQVRIDASALDQIMSNLVLNARDAIGNRSGTIRIGVNTGSADEDFTNGNVLLTVTDNGCGIPHDLVSKIFAPFVTTKDFGKGTGLGLPTVKRLVESAGGRIAVYSKEDEGTTMQILLPQAFE